MYNMSTIMVLYIYDVYNYSHIRMYMLHFYKHKSLYNIMFPINNIIVHT